MANPQIEDGHVDIANEIVEYLAKYRLSGQEWQVIWVILRKTWGWHKKKDRLSLGYIAKMTLMKRPAVSRAINKLVDKGVIKKDNSYINIYMFNKDFETWKTVIRKDTMVSKKITGVIKKDNKTVIKKDTTTKENTKETITKEIISSQIKNLLGLFPEMMQEEIQVYWDNAAQKNKTGIITEGRKLTLLTELYNLMKRTNDNNLFKYALETANRYGVANIGYVGAVIKNKITEVKD